MPIKPLLSAIAAAYLLLPAPVQASDAVRGATLGLSDLATLTLAQARGDNAGRSWGRDDGEAKDEAAEPQAEEEERGRGGREGRGTREQAEDEKRGRGEREGRGRREQAEDEERGRGEREGRGRREQAEDEERGRDEREGRGRREQAEEEERGRGEREGRGRREQAEDEARRQRDEAEERERREREEAAERDRRGREEDAERERRGRDEAAERDRQEREKAGERRRGQGEDVDRSRQQRDAGDDRRRPERARQSRRRIEERERDKTPASELSRTQIRDGQSATIDGGARTLRRQRGRLTIRGDDTGRLARGEAERRQERTRDGNTRTIVTREDGTQIITVRNRDGSIVRRIRRDRDGRERVLIGDEAWRRAPLASIDLGPLRLSIPREQYIVDARRASRRDLERALFAPPVERVTRVYSLEEVRRFDRVREIMPRIDMSTITFDFDSALIAEDQIYALEDLADIIHTMLDRDPDELILLEGHTDAPGSDIYNLALSDRRAEAVAIVLSDYYDVPPENLVTQGFGESYLKIATQAAERENRRVAVRRITPLVRSHAARD